MSEVEGGKAAPGFASRAPVAPDADEVWSALVFHAGANPEDRDHFRHAWPTTEFRFCGDLGFGGKVWWNAGRCYVSYYPEDRTERREIIVQRTNAYLATLAAPQAEEPGTGDFPHQPENER